MSATAPEIDNNHLGFYVRAWLRSPRKARSQLSALPVVR